MPPIKKPSPFVFTHLPEASALSSISPIFALQSIAKSYCYASYNTPSLWRFLLAPCTLSCGPPTTLFLNLCNSVPEPHSGHATPILYTGFHLFLCPAQTPTATIQVWLQFPYLTKIHHGTPGPFRIQAIKESCRVWEHTRFIHWFQKVGRPKPTKSRWLLLSPLKVSLPFQLG